HRPHLRWLKLPILDDGGREVAEGLDVEAVHDQAEAAENEDAGLKWTDFAFIENFGNIDGLLRHSLPPTSCLTIRAPSTIAFILASATSCGRYFKPQSGATMIRSALTNGSARRMRAATVSGLSTSWV